jgi:hypothetical protein
MIRPPFCTRAHSPPVPLARQFLFDDGQGLGDVTVEVGEDRHGEGHGDQFGGDLWSLLDVPVWRTRSQNAP